MSNKSVHRGVVVPIVTPVTPSGGLDEAAVDRIVDAMLAGGVEGIFVLGTTGEGINVPKPFRTRLVRRAVERANKQCLIYAGLGDLSPATFSSANEFFSAGADAVVAHPPVTAPIAEDALEAWFRSLLDVLTGPLILYNMPAISKTSIPLDAVGKLLGHPNLAGIKDSENNPKRHEDLLARFRGGPGFSIFVGVGALMEQGLKLGANGIVPSVGNLIPDVCRRFYEAAQRGDWPETGRQAARMSTVAALYQTGRTLGQSLAAIKAALYCRGICGVDVFPPIVPLSAPEIETVRGQMRLLRLLD